MRKKLIVVFIFVLSMLIIMRASTTNISNVVYKLDEVTKISFRNGGNGELVETDDKNKIKEFTSYLKDLVLKRKYFNSDSGGYSYYADFYVDNKKIMRITFTGSIDINGTKYKIINNEKENNYINRFVESLR